MDLLSRESCFCVFFILLGLAELDCRRPQPLFKTFGLPLDEVSNSDSISPRMSGLLQQRSGPLGRRGSPSLRLPPALQEYTQTEPAKAFRRREVSRVLSAPKVPRKPVPAFTLTDLPMNPPADDNAGPQVSQYPNNDKDPDYLSIANAAMKVDPYSLIKNPFLMTPYIVPGMPNPGDQYIQPSAQIVPYIPCRPDGPSSTWKDRLSGICAASYELGLVCGNVYKSFEVSISDSDCGNFDGHWCCYVPKMHRMGRELDDDSDTFAS